MPYFADKYDWLFYVKDIIGGECYNRLFICNSVLINMHVFTSN